MLRRYFNKSQREIVTQLISLTLCFAFVLTSSITPAMASSNVATATSQVESALLNDLTPPADLGSIVDARVSAKTPLVIHIQDLHANYSVQSNIVKLLEFLDAKLGAGTYKVAVEGAEGPVAVTELAKISNKEFKTKVCDTLMKEAELTGTEYFSIVNGKPGLLWGVEDHRYHEANIALFQSTYEGKRQLAKSLDKLQAEMLPIKDKFYTRSMRKLDKKAAKYEAGKIGLEKYTSHLVKLATRQGIDVAGRYPEIAKWTGLAASEKYADMDKLMTEQVALLKDVQMGSAKTEVQRNIAATTSELDMLRRLTTEELSTEEVRSLAPKLASVLGRAQSLLDTSGVAYDKKNLSNVASASLDFYSVALLRDKFLTENTLKMLKNSDSKIQNVVLVAGGFHTPGITKILKEQGVSYVTIAPTVTSHTEHDKKLYVARLMGRHANPNDLAIGNANLSWALNHPRVIQVATQYASLAAARENLGEKFGVELKAVAPALAQVAEQVVPAETVEVTLLLDTMFRKLTGQATLTVSAPIGSTPTDILRLVASDEQYARLRPHLENGIKRNQITLWVDGVEMGKDEPFFGSKVQASVALAVPGGSGADEVSTVPHAQTLDQAIAEVFSDAWPLHERTQPKSATKNRIQEILSHPDLKDEDPRLLANIRRLYSHGVLAMTGQLTILPIDQGLEHSPLRSWLENRFAANKWYQVMLAYVTGMSAYAAPYGTIKEVLPVTKRLGLPTIAKINNSIDTIGNDKASQQSALMGNIAELAAAGVTAIGFTIYGGSDSAAWDAQVAELKAVAAEAKKYHLPMVVWSYPRGKNVVDSPKELNEETALDVAAAAVKLAVDNGAQIIKVKPPRNYFRSKEAQAWLESQDWFKDGQYDLSRLAHRVAILVRLSRGRELIFSGGEPKTEKELLTEIAEIILGGGGGNIVGRNLFKREYSKAVPLDQQIMSMNMAMTTGKFDYQSDPEEFMKYAFEVVMPKLQAKRSVPLEMPAFGPEINLKTGKPYSEKLKDVVRQMLAYRFGVESEAVKANLERVYNSGPLAKSGKLLITPMGSNVASSAHTLSLDQALGMAHNGTLKLFSSRTPMIAKIPSSPFVSGTVPADYAKPAVLGQLQGLAEAGLTGVGYTLNPDKGFAFNAQVTELREIMAEAKKHGLFVAVWVAPTGDKADAVDIATTGTQIALEIGAHLVIINPPSADFRSAKDKAEYDKFSSNNQFPMDTWASRMKIVKWFGAFGNGRHVVVTVPATLEGIQTGREVIEGGADGLSFDGVVPEHLSGNIFRAIKGIPEPLEEKAAEGAAFKAWRGLIFLALSLATIWFHPIVGSALTVYYGRAFKVGLERAGFFGRAASHTDVAGAHASHFGEEMAHVVLSKIPLIGSFIAGTMSYNGSSRLLRALTIASNETIGEILPGATAWIFYLTGLIGMGLGSFLNMGLAADAKINMNLLGGIEALGKVKAVAMNLDAFVEEMLNSFRRNGMSEEEIEALKRKGRLAIFAAA